MNKEKEALLKAILAEPNVPRKIAYKNLLRFVERAKPETQEMREYLMEKFSAATQAESKAVTDTWYAKMTDDEQKSFSEAYYRCMKNTLKPEQLSSIKTIESELVAA
jgi:hypothetical protein